MWNLKPQEVLDLSLGEVELLTEEGLEKHKEDTRNQAALMACVYNAPFILQKEDESLWTADDLIMSPDSEPEDEELMQLAQARLAEAKATRMSMAWD